ncbi:ABC-2 type transport system ATP-binding protein [Paenibacillus turicensis]|uniref:ABC-2 type transport system ATP-binding protein n=1 Tax=Paenibacillus turicensis TaxID=160487 RepID=A0ABS4FUI0_9BACL|nr:ABC transporter ATP-binding protein [Paenibacillus turicensis]MBP1906119.1 ABC-2 type transport system ATP-binding protein [Paenibacillus turicensis]
MSLLQVENVTKTFGQKKVLNDLSFVVQEGSIFGFVGENGAGKTTTMKLILGLDQMTKGNISILGEAVTFGATKTNRFTGYLPDVPQFYDYMTAREYLMLCGEITGLPKDERIKRVEEMLGLVQLFSVKTRIGGFSRGMKQRLGIAQALLNKPKLLICDEPTSALDPNGRKEFLDLLYSLRSETTIIFSTHILNDVEQICDHVGILNGGKMVVCSSISELKKKHGQQQVKIVFEQTDDKVLFLEQLKKSPLTTPYTIDPTGLATIISFKAAEREQYKNDAQQLLKLVQQHNILPLAFEQQEASLEDIFLEVIR